MSNINKPLVTIAIPTYNRADGYLRDALNSAMNQTYENIEIVVSDNCSPDNTEDYIKGIDDPRIRYFRQKEGILPNDNFNFCLKQARGDYFSLLCDDDLLDDDFVATCIQAADYSSDIGIIRTGMRRIDSDGKVLTLVPNLAGGLSTEDFFMCWFRGKTPMHLCMSLFNTGYLRQEGGFNSRHNLFQDVLAEVRLAYRFGRVDIEDVKASYRMHSEQISSALKIKAWCEDSFQLLDTICDFLPDNRIFRNNVKNFMFRHNYNLACKNSSSYDRFASCRIVYKEFGYLYSLRWLFFSNIFVRKMLAIRQKMK